jgi:hypothetical protein
VSINIEAQAAKKGALFTQTMIAPKAGGWPVDWVCRIVPPAQADPAVMGLIIAALTGGPTTLGRTDARMLQPQITPVTVPSIGRQNIRLVLRSPALMVRQAELAPDATIIGGICNPARRLHAALAAYWDMATKGMWRMSVDSSLTGQAEPQFFASFTYRGDFEARFFRHFGADVVEPFVLTDAGSVFYLETDQGPAAEALMSRLMADGLPAAHWGQGDPVATTVATPVATPAAQWASCPFLPQNGFGAIEVTA